MEYHSILTESLILGRIFDDYIETRSLHLGWFPKNRMTEAANILFEIKIICELENMFGNKN